MVKDGIGREAPSDTFLPISTQKPFRSSALHLKSSALRLQPRACSNGFTAQFEIGHKPFRGIVLYITPSDAVFRSYRVPSTGLGQWMTSRKDSLRAMARNFGQRAQLYSTELVSLRLSSTGLRCRAKDPDEAWQRLTSVHPDVEGLKLDPRSLKHTLFC